MSMFSHEEAGSSDAQSAGVEDVTMLATPPFRRLLGKDKRALYKPTLDQSWYGSLHDAHLQ